MIKRFCDVCNKEMNRYIEHEWRDSQMQFYKLIRKNFDNRTEYEIDICNECLHKVVALTRGEFADMGGEELYRGDEVRLTAGAGLKPYRKSSILFLCDRTRCKNCSEFCNHTSDITYAKNKTKVMKFEKLLGVYMEVEE